jgi:hypothetical protein
MDFQVAHAELVHLLADGTDDHIGLHGILTAQNRDGRHAAAALPLHQLRPAQLQPGNAVVLRRFLPGMVRKEK